MDAICRATRLESSSAPIRIGETLGAINAANLREAHRRLESDSSIGKLVLAGWN